MSPALLALTVLVAFGVFVDSAPNVIIFLADDLGYGDTGPYGNTDQGVNAIDRMAQEGTRFRHWTAGGVLCSPSRAALLTGRYHLRSGVYGNDSLVFAPKSKGGLLSSETTLAEALKDLGYTTGLVGKWHLGINQATRTDGVHLPGNHGFQWVGTNLPHGQSGHCEPGTYSVDDMKDNCFVYNGSQIVEQPIDVKDLSEKLKDDALTFIRANRNGPFFLYLAFPHVHPAYFCNSMFCGKSTRGTYGDMINEMAWVIGEVLDELVDLGIDKDTLAVFTSDQGALKPSCRNTITNNGDFRGGKGTTWEGGYRVPGILWWPDTIAANTVSDTLVNHMDLFPTIVHLAGGSNSGKIIDGKKIPELVSGSPEREAVYYFCSDRLFAVRYDHYKLHYYTMGPIATSPGCQPSRGDYDCYGADIVEHNPPVVFDLNTANGEKEETAEDPNDSTIQQVITKVSELVSTLENSLSSIPASQIDLGNSKKIGPCCNPPNCECNYDGP